MDTYYIHIHLIINCINWHDGKRYDVPYEGKWINSMVEGWYQTHMDNLIKDVEARNDTRHIYMESIKGFESLHSQFFHRILCFLLFKP